MLGLGSSIVKPGKIGLPIVTDNLLLRHKYIGGEVHQVSTGAADINADAAANEYIDVGTIEITTNDVSVCAWVYITDWVNYGGIFANRHASGDNQGFELRCANGAQKFQILIDEATTGSASLSSSVKNSNQWYHVCVVMDRSSTVSLYVDGVADGTPVSITGQADSLTHATVAKIGQNYSTTEMRGYVCNVGYWNRVLTQAEVKSIWYKNYADLTTSEKTSLVSWWNLDTLTEFDVDGTGDGLVLDNNATLGSELITGFINGTSYPLDTFTSSGRNITAAIETSGNYGGCASNEFSLTEGEWYKCTFNLTYNSGTDPVKVILVDNANGASTHRANMNFSSTNGENVMYFKVSATDSTSRLQFGSKDEADVINFSASNISLKKINGNPGEIK